MAKLLHIESSPRKDRSSSIQVAKAFLEEYRKTHPGDTVETLDLWKTDLPRFDGPAPNETGLLIVRGRKDNRTTAQTSFDGQGRLYRSDRFELIDDSRQLLPDQFAMIWFLKGVQHFLAPGARLHVHHAR